MSKRFAVLAVLALCSLPAPARAVDVRIEISPMVSIPIGPFLDAVPVSAISVDSAQLGFNLGQLDFSALNDYQNSVGGGVGLSILFNNWEIRYEFMALPFAKRKMTHIGFTSSLGVAFYIPVEEFDDATVRTLTGTTKGEDVSKLDPVFIHNIGFGWRFVPFDHWIVQPYLPFGLGFSLAQIQNGVDPLPGFYVQLGLGVQYSPVPSFRMALEARYMLGLYKAPDISASAIGKAASGTLTTNASAFDAVMEDVHVVNVVFALAYKF